MNFNGSHVIPNKKWPHFKLSEIKRPKLAFNGYVSDGYQTVALIGQNNIIDEYLGLKFWNFGTTIKEQDYSYSVTHNIIEIIENYSQNLIGILGNEHYHEKINTSGSLWTTSNENIITSPQLPLTTTPLNTVGT